MKKYSKFTGKFLTIAVLSAVSSFANAKTTDDYSDANTNICLTTVKTDTCACVANTDPCFFSVQSDIKDLSSVSLDELALERGMGGILDVSNVAHLEAILTDNYISNSVTGNNTIDSSSFNDASGVFSIIQNTGNNVIIQDSTIITVTITPN